MYMLLNDQPFGESKSNLQQIRRALKSHASSAIKYKDQFTMKSPSARLMLVVYNFKWYLGQVWEKALDKLNPDSWAITISICRQESSKY